MRALQRSEADPILGRSAVQIEMFSDPFSPEGGPAVERTVALLAPEMRKADMPASQGSEPDPVFLAVVLSLAISPFGERYSPNGREIYPR